MNSLFTALTFIELAIILLLFSGCSNTTDAEVLLVWGRKGQHQGQFNKPRTAVLDNAGNIYVADMTGRIQKFNALGEYLSFWMTPDVSNGRPRSLAMAPDGTIVVCDCHYYCIRRYTTDGKLLETWGTHGTKPGELALMCSITIDNEGNIYTVQYKENSDAVQIFTSKGKFIRRFGKLGSKDGEFSRPMGIAVDSLGNIYVADCCNNRIQKFTNKGKHLKTWGGEGSAPGKMRHPYDIVCDPYDRLLVAEHFNSRVSKFDTEGRLLAIWGGHGTAKGKCLDPWCIAVSNEKDVYFVVDSGNDRIQKVRIPDGWGLEDYAN